jgi:hypothetical protein
LVPKKVISKKRKISQFKDKKEFPAKKKLKIEVKPKPHEIIATKDLHIGSLSDATKSLVSAILSKAPAVSAISMTPDKIQIKPYTPQTADLISRLKGISNIRQDLLQVSHKLVVPAKYKALLKMQGFLDSTLNFLGTRHPDWIPLKELQHSIAITQGKGFTLVMLRQILNLCPDFYEVKWQEVKYTDPTICVRFVSGVKILNFSDQQARQKELEKKILENTIKVHGDFL